MSSPTEIVFSTSRGRGNTSTLQSFNLGNVTGGGSLPDPDIARHPGLS